MNHNKLRDVLNVGRELQSYLQKEDELLRRMYTNGRKGIEPTEKEHELQVTYSEHIKRTKGEFIAQLREMGFRR